MLRSLIPCLSILLATGGLLEAQSYVPVDYHSSSLLLKSGNSGSTRSNVQLYLAPAAEEESGAADFIMLELRQTAQKLEHLNVDRKRQKKVVEMIREEVESKYLRHYNGLADFSDLFRKKEYNDLTAVAMVSMLLDELAMEHRLYLVGREPRVELADGTLLLVEQWGRNRPSASIVEEEQSRLVAVLEALQLTPESPLYRSLLSSSRATPDRRDLMPAELAGMLYYRRSMAFYGQRQFEAASIALERARTYYQDPRLDLIRYAILYQQAGRTAGDTTLVEPLFELYRLHPRQEVGLELVRRFAQLAEYHLLREGDHVAFERRYDSYRRLFAGQPAVLQQLKEIYFIEMAQYHAGRHEPHRVMTYLDSLHTYRPNDPKIQRILTPLLLKSLHHQKDPDEGLAVIEAYRGDFPFLQQEPLFRDLELCYRAERVRRAFDADREEQGRDLLETFERCLAQSGSTPRSASWITTAYTSASGYYFRMADYGNARWFNQRALALLPNDHFLLHRAEVLAKY